MGFFISASIAISLRGFSPRYFRFVAACVVSSRCTIVLTISWLVAFVCDSCDARDSVDSVFTVVCDANSSVVGAHVLVFSLSSTGSVSVNHASSGLVGPDVGCLSVVSVSSAGTLRCVGSSFVLVLNPCA